ncbi:hypothetical protein CDL15_Pgr004390 [Punica granatum]|uniref:Uncharacterized protein n=1 Tax=Punica granatum TaxID=22663 RepID=A0A218XGZ8_PUNGR|nr:hypothetical protein CDL15_Pgr004390 [Punica granatum]
MIRIVVNKTPLRKHAILYTISSIFTHSSLQDTNNINLVPCQDFSHLKDWGEQTCPWLVDQLLPLFHLFYSSYAAE